MGLDSFTRSRFSEDPRCNVTLKGTDLDSMYLLGEGHGPLNVSVADADL